MKTLVPAALLLALGPAWASGTDDVAQKLASRFEPILEETMASYGMPAFNLVVIKDGRAVYSRAHGVSSVDSKDPVTTRSLFHMASVTKPFVATAIMQLVEQGKIDLQAPVVKYLPYFKLADGRAATITIQQMLSHTSGMPDVEDYEWEKATADAGALERYVRSLTGHRLIFAPGQKQRYSNMAFEVLGDVIAKVAGQPFEDYLRDHILQPLKMADSTLLKSAADAKLLCSPHVMGETADAAVSPVFPYNRMHAPSSTLLSNVEDMGRWALANLNRGELDGVRILKDETYDVMWRPGSKASQRIGMSWFLGEHRGYRKVEHGGSDVGFVSYIVLLPQRSIAVVAMSNFSQTPVRALGTAALDVALGFEPTCLKRSLMRELAKTILAEGAGAGVAKYRELKKNHAESYDFRESVLNALGYALMRRGQHEDAAALFKLNVEEFPKGFNTYDSLAEAYMVMGNKELAIKNYKQSLKLNPDNDNAVRMLAKLEGG